MLTVYHNADVSSMKALERLSKDLIKSTYSDFIESELFRVFFIKTNSGVDKVYAQSIFKKGLLSESTFLRQSNHILPMERRISPRLSDLEADYRYLQVEKYLKSGFVQGLNFHYVRVPYTQDITSNLKLSDKAKIKLNLIDNSSGEVLEEGFMIKKGAEFEKGLSDIFCLRLENPELVGYNEINIDISIFKKAIESLKPDVRVAIEVFIFPHKIPSLKQAYSLYMKRDHSYKSRQKIKAIRGIIDYVISLEI
jgi:hypothetical protein